MQTESIRIAVVTGEHNFDVLNFQRLFRELEGVDAYIQHVDDFTASSEAVRDGYDVVLFYLMPRETPSDEGAPWYAGKPRTALEHLGKTSQGLLTLHHGSLAYREWSVWDEITGITERAFIHHPDQSIHVDVADASHPITAGLSGWDLVDETYTMNEPGAGSRILLTTDHENSMKSVAWTRQYGKSRVFCLQLGHDSSAYDNGGVRQVLTRGIQWCAGRI